MTIYRTIRVIPFALVLVAAFSARAVDAQTLHGRYWNAPSSTTADVAGAQAFMSANSADGFFTAQQSTLETTGYNGTDLGSAVDFLANDGASFHGTDKGMSDGLFDMSGFLTTDTARSYDFSTFSDDGSAMFIDGIEVVNNDGHHGTSTASGSAFLTAGIHTLDIVYFNWNFENGSGNANFAASFGGATVSPVPETSTVTLFGLFGVTMACFMIRSRKRGINV